METGGKEFQHYLILTNSFDMHNTERYATIGIFITT